MTEDLCGTWRAAELKLGHFKLCVVFKPLPKYVTFTCPRYLHRIAMNLCERWDYKALLWSFSVVPHNHRQL